MPPKMHDASHFLTAGLSPSKYSNTIDQYGNTVMPDFGNKNLKYESIVNIMRLQDLKEHINRYQWVNLPTGITAELIERMVYYRFKSLFYYNEEVEKFQFLPFALNKTIDEYGRYTNCNSLPFIGVSEDPDTHKSYIRQNIDIVYDDLFTIRDIKDAAVMEKVMKEWTKGSDKGIILNDYSLALSQSQPPRCSTVEPIISSMATCYQIINTAMFASADYNLINCQNEADYEGLVQQLRTVNQRILKGERYGAVIGTLKLESLKTTNASSLQDLWETYNSLDNLRKSTNGIANAGVFNKKERMLQQEQMLNGSNSDAIYEDGLKCRQRFCDLINQYYGLDMWCMSKNMPTPQEQMSDVRPDGDDQGTNMYKGEDTSGGEE